MISIIICSVNKSLRAQIASNIEATIGVEYQLIIIPNDVYNYSIARAYNLGAQLAQYPYLCFVHEDILFHTPSWGKILIRDFAVSKARLIGVLGCVAKLKNPSSVYLGNSNLNRQNHLQRHPDKPTTLCYENPLNETLAKVCTLDGLFIASTRQAWEETQFSEDYLPGFHGYDIDFSIKNFLAGKVLVTYNILLEHFSHGAYSRKWLDAQVKVTRKWSHHLPLIAPGVSKQDVDKGEFVNLKDLMAHLITHNYNPLIQWKYFIKHLWLSRLEKANLYYLRRIVFTKHTKQQIESPV